jgi:hypothetical protein
LSLKERSGSKKKNWEKKVTDWVKLFHGVKNTKVCSSQVKAQAALSISLCNVCALCASVVELCPHLVDQKLHHRDTEITKDAQRLIEIGT